MYFTQQDIINLEIAKSGTRSQSQIFNELIKEHRDSRHTKEAIEGDAYFLADNIEISSHDFTEYHDSFGVLHSKKLDQHLKNKADNRLPAGFHRKQVIEKAAYLAKNEINISHMNEQNVDNFKEALGRKFHETLNKIIEDASNRGKAWVHFYLDGTDLGFMTMNTCWIIPVYETSRQENLVRVIRYYPVTKDVAGKKEEKYFLEDWNDTEVVFYEQQEGDNFVEVGRSGHFGFVDQRTGAPIVDGDGNQISGSWGRVPFVEIKNNNQGVSDLHFIKRFIDAWDFVASSLTNNVQDFRTKSLLKAIGTSQEPGELFHKFMQFGVVCLEGGVGSEKQDVDYIKLDIPYEASKETLQILETSIAQFGMGLDFNREKYGDLSGVALRFFNQPLDLKSGLLEIKLKCGLYDMFWFVNKYLEITENSAIAEKEVDKFEFVFDKYMITNEQEAARLSNESKGSLSEETRLANDPRVDNVQEEIERMKEEKQESLEQFEQSLERRASMNGNGQPENVN